MDVSKSKWKFYCRTLISDTLVDLSQLSIAFASHFIEANSKHKQLQAVGKSPPSSPNKTVLRLDTTSSAPVLCSGYSSGTTPPISVDEAARHLAVTPTRSPVRRLSFRSSTASDSNSSTSNSVSANGLTGILGSVKASEAIDRTESPSPTKNLASIGTDARAAAPSTSLKTPTRPRTAASQSPTDSSTYRQPDLSLRTSPSPARRPFTANPPGRQTPSSQHSGGRNIMSAFGGGSSSAGASTTYRSKDMSPSYSAPSNRSVSGGYYNSENQYGRSPHGSKASQMLGIDPYSSVPISATSSFSSEASPPSTSSGGTFKSSTLKKARSLFSSAGNSKNAGSKSPNLPSPPLPQPYSQQLAHSRSHGSLQDARMSPMTGHATQGSPTASHRFPGDPYPAGSSPSSRLHQAHLSPGSSASHEHPYSASGTSRRKQSMPSIERRRPRTAEEDEDVACPVCLESLSIRLQGEKAHVVPVCGHKLHAECFDTAYGSAVQSKSRKKGPLGICGICRSEMKIDEDGAAGGKGKNSKHFWPENRASWLLTSFSYRICSDIRRSGSVSIIAYIRLRKQASYSERQRYRVFA